MANYRYAVTDVDKLTAKVWLLVTCLNASKFAIADLEPKAMKHEKKMMFLNLYNSIHNFLVQFKKRVSTEEIEILDSMSYDNVCAMTEVMYLIAQIPNGEIETFIEEIKEGVYKSVERANQNKETTEKN